MSAIRNNSGLGLLATLATLAFAALASAPEAFAAGATFEVLSSADSSDGDPGDGDCDPNNDENEEDCTLRAAIEESNANEPPTGERNLIEFGLVVAVQPATLLPAIVQPTEITTSPLPECGAPPGITISIDGQDALSSGLRLFADDSVVCGLTIQHFGVGVAAEGDETVVRRSQIGTNTAGTLAAANTNGVEVTGEDVQLDGNLISGNVSSGVRILEGAVGTMVTRSKIGTEVFGSNALPNAAGVRVEGGSGARIGTAAGGNTISGNVYGVVITGDSTGTRVEGNGIGTNYGAGNIALPNTQYGVSVQNDGGGSNLIGGEVSEAAQGTAACDDVCNTISGNTVAGVMIEGSAQVAGNQIGLNKAGTAALGQATGVYLNSTAVESEVGGAEAGERNVIAGNGSGVRLLGEDTAENVVRGNLIGLAHDGETAIPNSASGVALDGGAHDNLIGGTGDLGNVISGNGSYGVSTSAAGSGNRLEGNYIGTDEGGTDDVPNGFTGVRLVGGEGVTVGGTAAGAGNVISGNATNGVEIFDSDENTISGNYLGPDATGTAVPGGQNVGVQIAGDSASNLVGGTSAGARNVISGNESTGVNLSGASVTANMVEGNYIGLEPDGNTPLPNAFSGVTVAFAGEENTIGGSAAGAGNVISGNGNVGLRVESTEFTEILGNLIGTDASGLLDRGNTSAGIFDVGSETTIGQAGAGNVISGNGNAGLQIASTASPTVEGNTIGLGADGDTVIGNTSSGIDAGSSVGARIGDNGVGEGNVISGNGSNGVRSVGSDELRIEGNLIGTDADGEADRGNAFSGVFLLTADEATVGGTATGAGNTISGNGLHGVQIEGSGSSGGEVEGNVIGLTADSTGALGNEEAGVALLGEAGGMAIGGVVPGAGNTIAENGDDGVLVEGEGVGNRILGNSIYDNGDDPDDLGIDLFGTDGVDPNDLDDEDFLQSNRLQNFPVLTSAETKPGETNIAGSLNSEHNHLYRVEIFASDSCDASGNGEGETPIHATTINTDAGGDAEFDFLFAGTSPGRFATATATDLSAVEADGTSEFSTCLPIPPDTAIDSGPSDPTADNTPTFEISSEYGAASFECSIDEEAYAACPSSYTAPTLADGPHDLRARATAGIGREDPTPASVDFTVDTTPPDTTIDSGPSGPTADNTPTFGFSSVEVGATFECRVDAAAFAACTSPHTPATLGDGPHTLEVRALDALDNADASPASRSFSVDTTPPETTIDSGPERRYRRRDAQLQLWRP